MAHTLFYLEDDTSLAKVTTRAFVKRQFDVFHYPSLAQATENITEHIFSHALLDLKLEDGHSLNLIAELKKHHPDIKTVVLTGYSSVTTAVQAMKLGAVNYLAKPATIEQVLSAFEESADIEEDINLDDISLKRMEWEKIQQVLAENNGNISATARQLKMHRRTLQRKLFKKPVSE